MNEWRKASFFFVCPDPKERHTNHQIAILNEIKIDFWVFEAI